MNTYNVPVSILRFGRTDGIPALMDLSTGGQSTHKISDSDKKLHKDLKRKMHYFRSGCQRRPLGREAE